MNYILEADEVAAQTVATMLPAEFAVLPDVETLRWRLREDLESYAVVVGPSVETASALQIAESLRLSRPDVSVVLIRRRPDTALLTEAVRAGVRQVVSERDLGELREAVARAGQLAAAVRHTAVAPQATAGKAATVVTVFSAKGGAGKTTTSVNLAAQLAADGKSQVCLVDFDLAFGDIGVALRIKPTRTIAEAIPMQGQLDEAGVRSLVSEYRPGLSVLLAPIEPATADLLTQALTVEVLTQLRRIFDYVVIDTPPAFTEHVLAAFDISDVVILVATMDVPTLKNLKLTIETLDLLKYPRDRWRVVLNRADEKVGLTIKDVEGVLGATVAAQIPMSRDVAAAVNRGAVISLDQPTHPVSAAYRAIAATTVPQHISQAPEGASVHALPSPRRRWFTRRKALAS